MLKELNYTALIGTVKLIKHQHYLVPWLNRNLQQSCPDLDTAATSVRQRCSLVANDRTRWYLLCLDFTFKAVRKGGDELSIFIYSLVWTSTDTACQGLCVSTRKWRYKYIRYMNYTFQSMQSRGGERRDFTQTHRDSQRGTHTLKLTDRPMATEWSI